MKVRSLLVALALGVLPISTAHAVSVAITVAPPPIPVYEQPLCPVEGYLWTPGYYEYDYAAASYYWVDGVWVPPPRVGYLWTPGYWGYADSVYVYHTGFWGPTVGFYGGINYGYGYGGYGYYGGRWDDRVFRYNTAVTRVNVNNVHNTYVDNHFQARTDNHASFNGRNGITAQADRAERRAAQAQHLQATNEQRSARAQARTAHNPSSPQNVTNRDQGRNVGANRNGRQRESRNAVVAGRNPGTNPGGNINRRAARTAQGRNHTALVGNPNRRGGQQRLVRVGGGGGGRAFRAPGGGGHGGGRGGGGQRGNGHGGDKKH